MRETRTRDGRDWPLGTYEDVAWIQDGTSVGRSITSAIPAAFEAYATVVLPDPAAGPGGTAHDRALIDVLASTAADPSWWLGYLETGADDVVFPDAPRVRLYQGWPYVVVQAGPEQALRWRGQPRSWRTAFPDIAFPLDRSWLVSMLWDDDWRCVGGSRHLVDRLLADPQLDVREVTPDEDATPPGFRST